MNRISGDFREGYAEGRRRAVALRLGRRGPLVVPAAAGFPEFWYGLAAADRAVSRRGFRVSLPNLLRCNNFPKPDGVRPRDTGH